LHQHCAEETLSAYLDGDLESEASGRTAEHLAECPVCRQALAQVRAIRDAASAMEHSVPPERVWGEIRERIRTSRKRSISSARLSWIGVPALAAALLVVTLAGWFGQPARDTLRAVARVGRAPASVTAVAASSFDEGRAAEEVAWEYSEYVRGIDHAIDECRTALDENPGNARVLAAYSGASSDRRRAMDRLASEGQ
jgi:anti-sigma factor RsiW